jgi:hypothetical protein
MEIGDSEISQLLAEKSKNSELTVKLKELQSILDQYLSDRKKSPENPLRLLLEEMEFHNFTLEMLQSCLETKLEICYWQLKKKLSPRPKCPQKLKVNGGK